MGPHLKRQDEVYSKAQVVYRDHPLDQKGIRMQLWNPKEQAAQVGTCHNDPSNTLPMTSPDANTCPCTAILDGWTSRNRERKQTTRGRSRRRRTGRPLWSCSVPQTPRILVALSLTQWGIHMRRAEQPAQRNTMMHLSSQRRSHTMPLFGQLAQKKQSRAYPSNLEQKTGSVSQEIISL